MTTKTPNREQVQELVDKFKGRCYCYGSCSPTYKHPILKCEVEEKMLYKGVLYDESEDKGLMKFNSDILTELWQPCGFTSSLQSIIEDSGLEEKMLRDNANLTNPYVEILKSESARNLVEFIYNLNL